MEVVFISYDEAQQIIPFFKTVVKNPPYKEAREPARRILAELELVRSIDYSPLRGRQVILRSESDRDWLLEVLSDICYGATFHIKEEKGEGRRKRT